MRFEIVLNQVLILFLILLVGYVAARAKILDAPAVKVLSAVLLYVASPMLVFKSFIFKFSMERLANAGWVVIAPSRSFLSALCSQNLSTSRFRTKSIP